MAIYKSDVALKGTVLRQRNQELEGTITGQIELPVGTVLTSGDVVELFDLAPNTYLTYLRVRMPGQNAGADNGTEGTIGYASEGTLLTPDPDVDAFSAAADDGAGTFVEADLTGTNGTAFPGAGPGGGKAIWDNDIVHVNWYIDGTATDPTTAGFNVVTFTAKYRRVDLLGVPVPGDYTPTPIGLPTEPANQVQTFGGIAAGN